MATTSVALTGSDTSFYNANKAQIDRIVAAAALSQFAAGWIITLQRVSELGLDKFTTSDFYGGLRGFLDSFDLASRGQAYENVKVSGLGTSLYRPDEVYE